MPPEIDPLSLWAILRIQESLFAVPCNLVQSIMALHNYKPVPSLPSYIRGIVDYQRQPIYLLDMRRRLGLPPLDREVQDFIELMNAREQDHVNWLNTLEDCVNQGKAFTLATDPHKCKFGQWYYANLPHIKDNVLRVIMEKFERPHTSIHNVAIQVEKLVEERRVDEAHQMIKSKKNYELSRMIKLFSDARKTYKDHHQEIAVILRADRQLFALIVDEVASITKLSWEQWQPMEEMLATGERMDIITGMAEMPNAGLPVAILNLPELRGNTLRV